MSTYVERAAPADLIVLDETERARVLAHVERKRLTCPACKSRKFAVGDALYVGFLFLSEDLAAWFVGLTCRNPRCPNPHTGARLREREFRDGVTDPLASDRLG